MSQLFMQLSTAYWADKGVQLENELSGLFGIPDYVAFRASSHKVSYVISFEMKLRDWKRGLIQAFRYRNFSNESVLVLDAAHLAPALSNICQFRHSNIGLASFSACGTFKVYNYPNPSLPFSEDYSGRAVNKYKERTGNRTSELDNLFLRSTQERFCISTLQTQRLNLH